MSRLHAKQLRLLIAIDESGSLLSAAEKVGLTQPGASKALRDLETTLMVRLFERSNRGLTPTDSGKCVLRFARLIQADINNLRSELKAISSGAGGRLAVGVIMGAVPLLTNAISRLLIDQPHVSVDIVEDTSETLLGLIDRGRLDVAICRSTVSSDPQNYDATFLKNESLAVVANIRHPSIHAASVNLRDLETSRWIVYRAHMPMRRLLEREFHEASLNFPADLIETTSALATVSLLKQSTNLVALVSEDVAQFLCSHGLVGALPLRLRSRSEPYELVFKKNIVKGPVLDLFINALTELNAEHHAP